jgi:diaminopimelate decarboxylase
VNETARAADGGLTLGGIPAGELASTYGTPVLVIDLDAVDAAISQLRAAAKPHGIEISYAAKAFICTAFAAHLAGHAIGIDVCSLGELLTAERAGFPRDRITFHGAGKSDAELRAAADGRAGRIVVDGIDELARLAAIADSQPVNVLLRLNTGIEAHAHAFVRTSGDDSKFGLHARDEETAAAILLAHPNLRFAGLHGHVGSQIYEPDAFVANAEALVDAAARFAARGLAGSDLIVGGGFGIPTRPDADDETLDVGATLSAVARRVTERTAELGIATPRIGIEPGRSIVAPAGTTIYRVIADKRQSHRRFLVVDGGLAENPRPALYGAYHHVVAVTPASGELEEVTLCGRSCENDELGNAHLPSTVRAGDLLAMLTTGAYTNTMASNYNRFPRPAVVAVSNGTHRLFIRRESDEDVLRNDVI